MHHQGGPLGSSGCPGPDALASVEGIQSGRHSSIDGLQTRRSGSEQPQTSGHLLEEGCIHTGPVGRLIAAHLVNRRGRLPGLSAERNRQSVKGIHALLSCVRKEGWNYAYLLICARDKHGKGNQKK